MRKITLLSIIMLFALITHKTQAEIYFDLSTVGGTKVMDWASVATENAKAQTDRWLTLVAISSGTSGKCGTAANTFDIKTGSSRSITFYLAKCDNLTINANILTGRGLLVNINDAATNIQLDGTGACKDFVVPINSETNVKIKVTALTSSSAWTSFFTFNYAPKVPTITSLIAEGIAATIDQNAKTASVVLPYGTALTAITPTVVLGGTATSYSPSGAQDFSAGAVNYTATDGSLNSVYAVSVTSPSSPVAPTIALVSGSAKQNSSAGAAITSVVYNVLNATNAVVTGLPTGINQQFVATGTNMGALTISGTIDNAVLPSKNSFSVEATPVSGYSGAAVTVSGSITVKSATAKKICYLLSGAAPTANDTKMYDYLNDSPNYILTLRTAASTAPAATVYDNFDLIVLNETVAGANVEAVALKAVDKPILSFKAFTYSSGRWSWGTADNGLAGNQTITVKQPSHPIFNGLDVSAGTLDILTGATGVSIQVADVIVSGRSIVVAAAPKSTTGNPLAVCIHDVPATVRGVVNSKYLMIPISDVSYGTMNANLLKMVDNAIEYLINGTQFGAPSLQISTLTVASVSGTIDQNANTISLTVPMGTDRTAIIPTITLEGVGASVSPATAQNFTAGAVNYTVSDMISSKVYAVTLLEQGAGLKGVISGVNYDGKTIRNNNQQLLQVYDAMGRLVTSGTNDIDMRGNAKGIYMIKSASGLMKIVF